MITRNFPYNYYNYNIVENEKEYKIQVAAMGFAKDEAKVSLDGNHLQIELDHGNDHKEVFGMMKYNKTFIIPRDVESEKISASLENGLLVVSLPKQIESIRQISIC